MLTSINSTFPLNQLLRNKTRHTIIFSAGTSLVMPWWAVTPQNYGPYCFVGCYAQARIYSIEDIGWTERNAQLGLLWWCLGGQWHLKIMALTGGSVWQGWGTLKEGRINSRRGISNISTPYISFFFLENFPAIYLKTQMFLFHIAERWRTVHLGDQGWGWSSGEHGISSSCFQNQHAQGCWLQEMQDDCSCSRAMTCNSQGTLRGHPSQHPVVENYEFMAKALATKFYPQSLTPDHLESPSNIWVPKSLWKKPPNPEATSVYCCLACKYTSSQKTSLMINTRHVHLVTVVACYNCDRTYYKGVDWVTLHPTPRWYPQGSVGWGPCTSPWYCYQGRVWGWCWKYVNQSLLHNYFYNVLLIILSEEAYCLYIELKFVYCYKLLFCSNLCASCIYQEHYHWYCYQGRVWGWHWEYVNQLLLHNYFYNVLLIILSEDTYCLYIELKFVYCYILLFCFNLCASLYISRTLMLNPSHIVLIAIV